MSGIAQEALAFRQKWIPQDPATGRLPLATDKGVGAMRVSLIGSTSTAKLIALRLISAGRDLTMHDPAGTALASMAAGGGRIAGSIEEACSSAGIVMTMFSGDNEVEAAVFGYRGIVESLPRNAIHVGFSRISVACADRLVEAHWDAGQRYVSAPVSEPGNRACLPGSRIIAGGSEEVLAEVEPLLHDVAEVGARLHGWPSRANAAQHDQVHAFSSPCEA